MGADAPVNLLLVTADQWRGDTLGCLGHAAARTPNLDRLAARGALFARHYGQATPCGPARASLLTGEYACNHRSITNGTPLDARHATLATALRRAGHDPVLLGYTDTSVDPRTVPRDDPRLLTYESAAPGFRVELLFPQLQEAWLDHLAHRGHGRLTLDEAYATPLGAPARWEPADSETAFLADRFLRWLDGRGRDEPWIAHLAFLKPHPPLVAAGAWLDTVDVSRLPAPARAATIAAEMALHPWLEAHLERPFGEAVPPGHPGAPADLDARTVAVLRRVYTALVNELDHHLGRIVARLEARGELDRTLVIVTSDHGEMLGEHWMLGKAGFFPQAFHVPLLVALPGGARGRRVDAFSEHVDLMPTILEAFGLPVPLQCDGRSLLPFLRGHVHPGDWRRAATWEHDFRSVADRHYEHALGLDQDDCALLARFDGTNAYVHFNGLPPLLFDVARDGGWTTNLAADPAHLATLAAMRGDLLTWRMRQNERRLTHAQLTPDGVAGEYDPA